MTIAFIGLGKMGEPMARNLLRAGTPLTVWNRSAPATARLVAEGAAAAASARDALRGARVAILMLANASVSDDVLERGSAAFAANVAGRLIIAMGTTAPDYSRQLEQDIVAAGGRYLECPVSGSQRQAETATLVAMLAGHPDAIAEGEALVQPMVANSFRCGAAPGALATKLSVNVFLINLVVGLAEAAGFAARHGVDLAQFRDILAAGPMASATSKLKLDKLVAGDFAAQASINDVLMNSDLIMDAARLSGATTPLSASCNDILRQCVAKGIGDQDMIATWQAMRKSTP